MKKLTEQEKKDLKTLNANLQKHEEQTQSKKGMTQEQKIKYANFNFEFAERRISEEVDGFVERAERLVDDLKKAKKDFNENDDEGFYSKADEFGAMLGTIQNCFNNYSFRDAARVVANYQKAKEVKNIVEGKKW